jgi:hypothetical protein
MIREMQTDALGCFTSEKKKEKKTRDNVLSDDLLYVKDI